MLGWGDGCEGTWSDSISRCRWSSLAGMWGKETYIFIMSQVLDDCLYEQRELPLINIFINIFLLFAHFIRLEWAGQPATFQ